jgi:hypothetical protein
MSPEQVEQMEIEMKIDRESGFGRWSWLAIIDKLSGGDFTKHDQVYKSNFIACLNTLSFWKERDKRDEELRRQLNIKR